MKQHDAVQAEPLRRPAGVAPRAGAWIETRQAWRASLSNGLRLPGSAWGVKRWIETSEWFGRTTAAAVAPRAGAWIETTGAGICSQFPVVAPRAGAWIET